MTRAPFLTGRPMRKHYRPRNPALVEAYFAYPLAGPVELAQRTGMTVSEVIEGLARHGLPMNTAFERERTRQIVEERYK